MVINDRHSSNIADNAKRKIATKIQQFKACQARFSINGTLQLTGLR
jgi:hypothetical protein